MGNGISSGVSFKSVCLDFSLNNDKKFGFQD